MPIDSQRQEAQYERRTLIQKRDEVIKEQELAVAEKERAIERKRALLKQQAQAQRMKEQADLEEQELLERERRLQERLNRMKEREKEIEILEHSLRQPGSLASQEDRRLAIVSDEMEQQKEVPNKSKEKEKQQFQSEEEIKVQMLKDRQKSLIDRKARIFEDDRSMSTMDSRRQPTEPSDREKEDKINLDRNYPFPKFTPFSGEDPKPKGEASYEEWRYEVDCLLRDKAYSKYVIGQAIRKSLRGQAKRMLIPMGINATIEEIMDRLESEYGNCATGMSILQEFFTAIQQEKGNYCSMGSSVRRDYAKSHR